MSDISRLGESLPIVDPETNRLRRVQVHCQRCGNEFEAIFMGKDTATICLDCFDKSEVAKKKAEDEEILRVRFQLSNLPVNTQKTHRLGSFLKRNQVCKDALIVAKTYLDGKRGHHFITFYSKVKGTGKTHLALGIAWYFFEKGLTVRYHQAAELLDYLRAGYNITDEHRQSDFDSRMNLLRSVKLLIIDDFGDYKATPFALERFDNIVDTRYLNRRLTVFTTNLTSEELEERGEGRISSRINEGILVHLNTNDYREEIRKKRFNQENK